LKLQGAAVSAARASERLPAASTYIGSVASVEAVPLQRRGLGVPYRVLDGRILLGAYVAKLLGRNTSFALDGRNSLRTGATPLTVADAFA